LGFELWSVSADILFDNIIITDEKQVADDWAEQSWVIKRDHELAGVASAVSCSVTLPVLSKALQTVFISPLNWLVLLQQADSDTALLSVKQSVCSVMNVFRFVKLFVSFC